MVPRKSSLSCRMRVPVVVLAWGVALGVIVWSGMPPSPVHALQDGSVSIAGTLTDEQGRPVCAAEVSLLLNGDGEPVDTAETHCEDGTFTLLIPADAEIESVQLVFERPHFERLTWQADSGTLARLRSGGAVRLPALTMARRITAAFWIATATFVAVLVLIALEVLHNTLASLLGVAVVLITSALGRFAYPGLFIFEFERALSYVNFEVIFLVMGMMIVIAAIEGTGIFQWVTLQAYRLSGGRVWLLVVILMVITSVASALLDNVTTMLLMAPLTIQIALALGVSPLSLLLPEVLASNVGGISTLIGTPTNIMIGSYAGLSFNDFLVNLTPGVLLALVALGVYVILRYRKGWQTGENGPSEALLQRLEEGGRIKEPQKLLKAGIIFGLMILAFVLGERIHIVPAVTAITGAAFILLFVERDIETMMQLVDWTTLMFFITLFILVGAIQEVGLLAVIAGAISRVVGGSLIAAIVVLVWAAALLSGVIANIPFTAAMLPVVEHLSRMVPGAASNVLYYSLSVGSAMGGNSSLIGASANMVTAGIAERAGYRIGYVDFLKIGLPATLITVAVGTGWLLLHFLVLK